MTTHEWASWPIWAPFLSVWVTWSYSSFLEDSCIRQYIFKSSHKKVIRYNLSSKFLYYHNITYLCSFYTILYNFSNILLLYNGKQSLGAKITSIYIILSISLMAHTWYYTLHFGTFGGWFFICRYLLVGQCVGS